MAPRSTHSKNVASLSVTPLSPRFPNHRDNSRQKFLRRCAAEIEIVAESNMSRLSSPSACDALIVAAEYGGVPQLTELPGGNGAEMVCKPSFVSLYP
jgi:hypothetical protein